VSESKPTFRKRLKAHEDEHPWFWGISSGSLLAVGTFFAQSRGKFEAGWMFIALFSLISGTGYAFFVATYMPKLRRQREEELAQLKSLRVKR
jgi:hypothetical protein